MSQPDYAHVPADSVREEVYGGVGTGVEAEVDSEDPANSVKPWDPERIRVSTKNFSLRNVLDMVESADLELAPDFQRNKVWKDRQKSRLIESLMLQIPLPAFYFAEDADGLLRVVDGLQRLSTIHDYVRREEFRLDELEYLASENGKTFSELTQVLQRRLNNAQIVVHVIDPTTPDAVKYNIFKRINTGGEPLNAMEVRHCMTRQRSRDFLRKCADSHEFQIATGGVLKDHVRMQDRECALRFVAFRLLGDIRGYDEFGTLEDLLDWAAAQLDDVSKIRPSDLDRLFAEFKQAMSSATLIFGEHAFRKWPTTSDNLSPINRALFESWAVTLVKYGAGDLMRARSQIVAETRDAMTGDGAYIGSISSSTSSPNRVRKRFETARAILESAVA
jgi:hypothetical protein